jgi:hypothetical protein
MEGTLLQNNEWYMYVEAEEGQFRKQNDKQKNVGPSHSSQWLSMRMNRYIYIWFEQV